MKKNWSGEGDEEKGDENKSMEKINHLMFGSICEHLCKELAGLLEYLEK